MTRIALLLFAAALAGPSPASAQSGPLDAALACRDIDDDAARLACQDAALADLSDAVEAGRIRVVAARLGGDRPAPGAQAGSASTAEAETETGSGPVSAIASLGGLFRRDDDGEQAQSAAREEALEDGSVAVYDRDGEIDEVRGLPVARVSADRFDRLTVYLQNGQVWRQTSTDFVSPPDEDEFASLTAEIDSGLFGSYFMELSHNGRRFRAERVR